jgi:type II secretory pathway pseudopilin PulG
MRGPHLRRVRIADQRGISLVELVVAMGILSTVLLVFTTTLSSMQRAVVEEDVRSRLSDDARLALQSIDRQVRSGNLLYDPATETGTVDPFGVSADGQLFRVYTQVQFGDDEAARCALWFVDDQRRLLYRYWAPLDEDNATDWQVIATGVVNRDEGTPAFSLDGSGRTLTAVLQMNPDLEAQPEATQRFEIALTGRNTSFGYPTNVCEDLPPDM